MSILLKAGTWFERNHIYKGEFNLTKYVTDLVTSIAGGGGDPRPYKVYSALLNCLDTDNPVAIVLENNTGFTISWARVFTGTYDGTFSTNVSSIEKVHFTATSSNQYALINTFVDATNIVEIKQTNLNPLGPGLMDGLSLLPIEIRIYN